MGTRMSLHDVKFEESVEHWPLIVLDDGRTMDFIDIAFLILDVHYDVHIGQWEGACGVSGPREIAIADHDLKEIVLARHRARGHLSLGHAHESEQQHERSVLVGHDDEPNFDVPLSIKNDQHVKRIDNKMDGRLKIEREITVST